MSTSSCASSPGADETTTSVIVDGETTTSAIIVGSVSGSHILKIEGYSHTLGVGVGEKISSSTFSVGGHVWKIGYCPNGWISSRSNYIAMSLALMETCTDDAAKVRASFKISLLDHAEGKHVVTKAEAPILDFHKGTEYVRFNLIDRKVLEESTYLKDDRIEVRCDITVIKEIAVRDTVPDQQLVVAVPPSDIHEHFGQLLSGGEGADVKFNVGDETFAAHRCVLAARSSVFKAELFGPMKEKTATRVQIDDMDARAFKAMLHFIYTDTLPATDDETELRTMAQHLLVAADRYNLDRLKLISERWLSSDIDRSTVTTTLTLAEQHGCPGLKKACLEFLRSPGNLKAVMPTDGFQHLASSCPSLLIELLAKIAI